MLYLIENGAYLKIGFTTNLQLKSKNNSYTRTIKYVYMNLLFVHTDINTFSSILINFTGKSSSIVMSR